MRKLLLFVIISAVFFITGCETEITKHCRVIYDCYGFTGGERPVDFNYYTPGMKAVVLKNTFQKTGYTFKHWNTKSDDTGEKYNPDEKLEITDEYFIHLYAMWESE